MRSVMLSIVGISAVMQFMPQAAAVFFVSSPIHTALNPENHSCSGLRISINPLTVEPLVKVT